MALPSSFARARMDSSGSLAIAILASVPPMSRPIRLRSAERSAIASRSDKSECRRGVSGTTPIDDSPRRVRRQSQRVRSSAVAVAVATEMSGALGMRRVLRTCPRGARRARVVAIASTFASRLPTMPYHNPRSVVCQQVTRYQLQPAAPPRIARAMVEHVEKRRVGEYALRSVTRRNTISKP